MSSTLTISTQGNIAGKNFQGSDSVSDDVGITADASVLVAQPGTVTTQTDTTHGVITMGSSGHGITTANIVDVYWAAGRISGMAVSGVTGTAVTVSGGNAEFNFPATTTVVTVCPIKLEAFPVTGNNLQGLAMQINGGVEGIVSFVNGSTVLWTRHIIAGNQASFWTINGISTNPLSGNTATGVRCSHADIVSPHVVNVAAVTH